MLGDAGDVDPRTPDALPPHATTSTCVLPGLSADPFIAAGASVAKRAAYAGASRAELKVVLARGASQAARLLAREG